ncbi:LysR family transcriptional regulator [Pseudoalteromonas fenneropenaei]|uniref:LysR family transcriptional regulator n=1 Tax=Pseudoalteromonas fenneropenaei TaxID=1737459 RepID=A0ABV7CI75_9GAMM
MDIEALRSLLAFVETGSFTRAAKQAHRTQAAISMQMKKLEEELGKPLFVKYGRNLLLTAEGQQLARYARQLVNLHDETIYEVKRQSTVLKVRLGCPDDYVDCVLPRLSDALEQLYDEVDLRLFCAPSYRLRIMLDAGHLDAAVVSRVPASEEGFLLQTGNGIWVGAKGTQLHHANCLPITLFEQDCKFNQAVVEGLIKQGRAFKVMATSSSLAAQRALINANKAIGAMADISLSPNLEPLHDNSLPNLPKVELALAIPNNAKPLISHEQALRLSELYKSDTCTRDGTSPVPLAI